MLNSEQKKIIADKFIADPSWVLVEQMLNEYLEPLKDISSIDTKRSNDEIATEVKGRQITIEQLNKFLSQSRILGGKINNKITSFK